MQFFERYGLRGWRQALAAAFVAVSLVACGGGGDGGSPALMQDSFGRAVTAESGFAAGDAGLDGTAAQGLAIAGGTVTVTDAGGRTATTTTDAQGYFRVKITGFTAPFVVKVTTAAGRTFYSFGVQPARANGFVTVNVSTLTDKLSADVARARGVPGAAQLTPQLLVGGDTAIANALAALRAQLDAVIRAAGLDPASFNPLNVPFVADHTGYDKVLDRVVVTVASDGSAVVTVTPDTSGYAGTWNLTVLAEGQSLPGGPVPGAAVPTAEMLALIDMAAVRQQLVGGYSQGGYTVSGNGSTVTITGPNTNFRMTINSFAFSGYQGCGACGIGSVVSYRLVASVTAGGTLDGQSVPTSTQDVSMTFRYVRAS